MNCVVRRLCGLCVAEKRFASWCSVHNMSSFAEVLARLRGPLVASHLQSDDVLALVQLLLREIAAVSLCLFGSEALDRDIRGLTL